MRGFGLGMGLGALVAVIGLRRGWSLRRALAVTFALQGIAMGLPWLAAQALL